MHNR
jgi:hypothetical protein